MEIYENGCEVIPFTKPYASLVSSQLCFQAWSPSKVGVLQLLHILFISFCSPNPCGLVLFLITMVFHHHGLAFLLIIMILCFTTLLVSFVFYFVWVFYSTHYQCTSSLKGNNLTIHRLHAYCLVHAYCLTLTKTMLCIQDSQPYTCTNLFTSQPKTFGEICLPPPL